MAERKPPARSGTAQLPLLQPGQEQKQARKECLAPGYSSSFGYNGFGGSGNFNCGSDYDRCFTDICGGTIRRIVEQPQ